MASAQLNVCNGLLYYYLSAGPSYYLPVSYNVTDADGYFHFLYNPGGGVKKGKLTFIDGNDYDLWTDPLASTWNATVTGTGW